MLGRRRARASSSRSFLAACRPRCREWRGRCFAFFLIPQIFEEADCDALGCAFRLSDREQRIDGRRIEWNDVGAMLLAFKGWQSRREMSGSDREA
jgi:hypothetical protein